MDFLHNFDRPKIVRTALYEDQEFTRFELELVHTPVFQRLYELKQLGYSDRVFPDAMHSRFNHLLGVTEIAERMAKSVTKWLQRHGTTSFRFSQLTGTEWSFTTLSGEDLAAHVKLRIPVLRMMGLLHDLPHAAFGHTLEDEVSVFKERHDEPQRQVRFFNALVAQLVNLWAVELRVGTADTLDLQRLHSFEIDIRKTLDLAERIGRDLLSSSRLNRRLAKHLRELELAFRLLLCLDGAHVRSKLSDEDSLKKLLVGESEALLISEVVSKIDPTSQPEELLVHRDLYLIDLVGNTICADLIDYTRRDAANAGLRVSIDDRVLRYLCLVPVEGREFVPGGKAALRIAIQVFTNKLRHDVLSEMSALLKARYLISERIIFHPTKCAAGACLGTAVQLIGLEKLPAWLQSQGDQAFLDFVLRCTVAIEATCDALDEFFARLPQPGESDSPPGSDVSIPERVSKATEDLFKTEPRLREMVLQCLTSMGLPNGVPIGTVDVQPFKTRAQAARRILLKLGSRRYPKLAYRLHDSLHSGRRSSEKLAQEYTDPVARFKLEREVEQMCALPLGTVHIHCPVRNTTMKVAEALVIGSDINKVNHLRRVTHIYDGADELVPYQEEICAVEKMYKSIWRLHGYVDSAHVQKSGLISFVLEKKLGFPNDPLLANESEEATGTPINAYDILKDREQAFSFDHLPLVVRKIDERAVRHRHESVEKLNSFVADMIMEVAKEAVQEQKFRKKDRQL